MKIKMQQSLYNIKGIELKDEKKEVLKLKDILINTTLTDVDKEEDKLANFKLGMKLNKADKEVDLTAEEITALQKKIKKVYSTLIVGQVHEILEGHENPIL